MVGEKGGGCEAGRHSYECCVYLSPLGKVISINIYKNARDGVKINTAKRTHILFCSPSSLFLLPTSAAELIPRMPLMEYEEPAESLVTPDTCVAATEVAADRNLE